MTKQVQHRSIAALKLPRSVALLLSIARTIVMALTGNSAFPSPQPTLAAISAAIADLDAAEAAARKRGMGTVATRDQKRAVLVKLLEQLKAHVQTVADADPEHAAALIQSAAMTVRKVTLRKKRVFAVRQGAASGAVTLVTASAGHKASYEWQVSADGGKTWQVLPATLRAQTAATGLQPGVNYAFRTRAVTTKATTDWSDPLTLIVR